MKSLNFAKLFLSLVVKSFTNKVSFVDKFKCTFCKPFY